MGDSPNSPVYSSFGQLTLRRWTATNPAAFPSFWETWEMRQVQVYQQSATLVHFYSEEAEESRGGGRRVSPHSSLRVLACCHCRRFPWLALADLLSSDIAACWARKRKGRLIARHVKLPPALSPGILSACGDNWYLGRREVVPPVTWDKMINVLILVLTLDSNQVMAVPSGS